MGHPAQAGKDISLNMCVDFNRARTPPWEGSGKGATKTGGQASSSENSWMEREDTKNIPT